MYIAGNVHGSDERGLYFKLFSEHDLYGCNYLTGRIIRRTLARYLLLLMTLTCQAVSTSVRRRFPTLDHVEEAGIMTKEERIVYDKIPGTHGKYWAPTVWFTNLLIRARKEGRIKDDILLMQMLDVSVLEARMISTFMAVLFAFEKSKCHLVIVKSVNLCSYEHRRI